MNAQADVKPNGGQSYNVEKLLLKFSGVSNIEKWPTWKKDIALGKDSKSK